MAAGSVAQSDIDAYRRDGVVCLRGAIEAYWIEGLRAGFERNLTNPSDRASVFYDDAAAFVGLRDAETRGKYTGREVLAREPSFMNDMDNWLSIPEYEDALRRSPIAEIAGRLMGARKANLFLQDVLLKDAGADKPTPWHQDMPFFPMEGDQTCTVWIPLDPIRPENRIEYVAGSHLWGQAFLPLDMDDPDDHYGADMAAFTPTPDVDARRGDYRILSWEMEPGDIIVHHGYALHGAPGNSGTRARRTFLARFTGDDVRYHGEKHKRLGPAMPHCGLAEGAAMDCEAFPVLWQEKAV